MFWLGILILSIGCIISALGIASLVISEIEKDKKFGKNGWRKE